MQQLWDIEQIKQLKAKYCYYVDEYFEDPANFDRLMHEVFVDDTELDFGEVGTATGRAEVEKFFRNAVFGALSFCQHLVHSPLITFSGARSALKIRTRYKRPRMTIAMPYPSETIYKSALGGTESGPLRLSVINE